jgi:alpha-tubulin suppressor-like RCC1 family protein
LSDVISDSNDDPSISLPNPLSREPESSLETDPDMMFVVQSPTAILFPKFTEPIMTVSCGLSHCLAVTTTGKLYSWGNGAYGALGFNSVQNEPTPRELVIKQNNFILQIQQVSCGSMHSMAVTTQNKLFTWGTGTHGRLGHGNFKNVLEPKELLQLSNLRVINISAGESHSAAVTQNLKAYTWGNGTFGRLGHG